VKSKQNYNPQCFREFLTFAYQTGGEGVEVRVQDGTVWLPQKLIASLFGRSTENIIIHIKKL
jgi:hypothetical protein